MTLIVRIFASALLLCAAFPAVAHEFWIQPFKFQVAPGKDIRADFRNGENFAGMQLAFFARTAARTEVIGPNGRRTIKPRDGDRPAMAVDAPVPGLYVLAHESKLSRVTYQERAKWDAFVAHKDLGAVASKHDARGLPNENFKEGYTRHAKALVAVGAGQGADRRLGLGIELVALSNPYLPGYGGTMQAQLFYKGAARGNTQVEVFELKPGASRPRVFKVRTNGSGVARVPTKPGHNYLLDAVVLRVPESGAKHIAWETLWASLTFAHP